MRHYNVHSLSWMAEVADMRNMVAVATKIRLVIAEADRRGVRDIYIVGMTPTQAETLNNLWPAAYELMNEVGQERVENERDSEAYRMGYL